MYFIFKTYNVCVLCAVRETHRERQTDRLTDKRVLSGNIMKQKSVRERRV